MIGEWQPFAAGVFDGFPDAAINRLFIPLIRLTDLLFGDADAEKEAEVVLFVGDLYRLLKDRESFAAQPCVPAPGQPSGPVGQKWTFSGPEGQESVAINSSPFLVNSADAMKTAITSGMGVGLLPVYAAIELRNGTLVRVMPTYRSQELEPVRHLPLAPIPGCKDQNLGGIPARFVAGNSGGTGRRSWWRMS